MAKKPTMTAADWREAKALAVQGTKYEEIALRFGIAVVTLRQRARDHDWQTPGRIAHKQRMAKQGVVQVAPQTLSLPRVPRTSPHREPWASWAS